MKITRTAGRLCRDFVEFSCVCVGEGSGPLCPRHIFSIFRSKLLGILCMITERDYAVSASEER